MLTRRRKMSAALVSLCLVSALALILYRSRFQNPPYPPRKGAEPTSPGKTILHRAAVSVQRHVLKLYGPVWKKQAAAFSDFWSNLTNKCHGASQAIITQANTPLGSNIVYDGEKKHLEKVTPELFSTFVKEQPFANVTYETCSVVGNGGILVNSSCGEEIDSAQLVLRCNLPPVGEDYRKDVGNKTNMVTANPSILLNKFHKLTGRRRPFVLYMGHYEGSVLLLPAFSYTQNLPVSLRAVYTLEEFGSRVRPAFLNPVYLQSLAEFWGHRGLQVTRISTGLILVSLALEHCAQVNLYGFWPYNWHPYSSRSLTNHYYDNQPFMPNVHDVPAEFKNLLQLHSQGVLKLHLDKCGTGHGLSGHQPRL